MGCRVSQETGWISILTGPSFPPLAHNSLGNGEMEQHCKKEVMGVSPYQTHSILGGLLINRSPSVPSKLARDLVFKEIEY